MRDTQAPKFLVVGISTDGDQTLWRVQRARDMAICAAEQGYMTDDGVLVSRPRIREWVRCEGATAYATALEDGEPADLDTPDVWVQEPMFMQAPPGPHIDGPL